jgi:transcriptional regulator with XRE-family HTH domain
MENALKNHIAATIHSARKSMGLTQEELAALINRTPESLSNIERGHSIPTIETLYDLASVLKLDISSLLPSKLSGRQSELSRLKLEERAKRLLESLDNDTLKTAVAQLEALGELRSGN